LKRPAIEGGEVPPRDVEIDGHYRAIGTSMDLEAFFRVAGDTFDFRIREEREIEFHRLLG